MSAASSDDNRNLLVRAIECKSRQKINIGEFMALLASDPTSLNINERGIYLLYLSDLLLKAFLSYTLRLNGFIGELEQREAKKRKRREEANEGAVRRKRNKNRN